MRKTKSIIKAVAILFLTGAILFTGCTPQVTPEEGGNNNNPAGENEGNNNQNSDQNAFSDYTKKIDCSEKSWEILTEDLSKYANKEVKITLSTKIGLVHSTNNNYQVSLNWQINHKVDGAAAYPVLFSTELSNKWTTVSETKTVTLGEAPIFYLSTYGIKEDDLKALTVYLKDFKLTVVPTDTGTDVDPVDPIIPDNSALWTDESVPSLKETYKDIFDSIGIACEYSSWNGIKELSVKEVRDGIAKHADSVSMGNEFKPDGFFGWQWNGTGKEMIDFTASNGETIKVPKVLQFDTQDKCLAACKDAGLKMRGHVLAWHAQTPEAFFTENYAAPEYDSEAQNILKNKVSKKIMQARLEWYIKTVLAHVAEWETKNNYHAIWAWDVFNETVADDATEDNWVRGSTPETKDRPPAAPAVNPGPCGSRWYQCYGDTDFIVDAFRFANAYAPSDVKLCYNDYNEYMNYGSSLKTDGILKLIQLVKNGEAKTVDGKSVKPRIDVMGMQSHVGVSWPGVNGYETALKKFLTEVDVHVTELDIACTNEAESEKCWFEYFTMMKKYGKKYSGNHKITNITVWGINNKSSWIYKGDVKYPLLFDDYKTTKAYIAVLEAAK